MFRNLTLFSTVLAIIVVILTYCARFFLSQELSACNLVEICQKELDSYYLIIPVLLVVISLVMLSISWWQKKCRLAAVTATLALTVLIIAQIVMARQLGLSIINVYLEHTLLNIDMTLWDDMLLNNGFTLLGFASIWLLFGMYLRVNPVILFFEEPKGPVNFARATMLLLFVETVLGTWVNGAHAALVCESFYQCNEAWWPQIDYHGLLETFITNTNAPVKLDVRIAVQWLHRIVALACFAVFMLLTLRATSKQCPKPVKTAGLWLGILVFAQFSLGIAAIELSLPLWAAVAHSVIAALLMLPLIAISFYSRYGYIDEKTYELETEQQISLAPAVIAEDVYVEKTPESLFVRLKTQLNKTRSGLSGILAGIPLGQKAINEDLLEEIEASLLMADIGVDATAAIISRLTASVEQHQLNDGEALTTVLKQELLDMLLPCNLPLLIPKQDQPFVILVVGVNGAGKTTTIGKLAKRLQTQGYSVMLAAGDTFRAAAVEQLQTWGERNNIAVVAQHTGADSASVIYDALQSAQAKGIDVLIADTAGRLHTKSHLMDELKKVKRIMSKLDENAPHEVLLVLDAGTGQNALSQAKLFNATVTLTGLALTKLDGTAKGGVIFALARQFGIPIRYIGIGEGIDDLQDFDAETFVNALFIKD
jgi:fused signal recognition particle receptor